MEKSIEEMTDDELLSVLRMPEDATISGSQYQRALGEWQIRQQKALLANQRAESSKLTRANWALVGVTLLIGIMTLVITLHIAHNQSEDDFKKESATLMFQFSNDFRNAQNSPLVYAVATGDSILKKHFTDEQLDNYLVKYEILYNAYVNGLISDDDLKTAFGFDIRKANENQEIKNFIAGVRTTEGDSSLYIGFFKLGQLVNK